MFVSSRVLELAVANLLQELGVQASQPFAFGLLSQRWPRTGLRAADLRDAINELIEQRLLRVVGELSELSFALTASGAKRLLNPDDSNLAGARAFGAGTLQAVQQRALHPAAPRPHERRHTDPA